MNAARAISAAAGSIRASDLMKAEELLSIRHNATLEEALALLVDKGRSALPVIDERGRPLGVLSGSDILVHEREQRSAAAAKAAAVPQGDVAAAPAALVNPVRVSDLMTPAVFAVAPTTTLAQVVDDMLAFKVHQLFVVDNDVLVGVIGALDVLHHCRPG